VPLVGVEHTLLKMIYETARWFTMVSGQVFHVDHRLPIALGGKHHPYNLQILTAAENQRKGCNLFSAP